MCYSVNDFARISRFCSSELTYTRSAGFRSPATMRWSGSMLLLVIVVALVAHSDAVSDYDAKWTVASLFGAGSLRASQTDQTEGRLLRVEGMSSQYDEEREMTAFNMVGTVVKALRMKAKLNVMLTRGFAPSKVLNKLKVTKMSDKNFNNFARYYAKYVRKYPKKVPKLPATAEDVILLPKLSEWFDQKLLPVDVKQKLKELGTSDTKKYLQIYLKDADETLVSSQLKQWLSERVFPPQIRQKLQEIGLTDVKYAEKYMSMWGQNQARMSALGNAHRI